MCRSAFCRYLQRIVVALADAPHISILRLNVRKGCAQLRISRPWSEGGIPCHLELFAMVERPYVVDRDHRIGSPRALEPGVVLVRIGVLETGIEKSVALAERIWGRRNGAVPQVQRIGRGGVGGGIVQAVACKECDVGPALSKVRRESHHGRPVVKEPSITGAEYRLVIDTICHAQPGLNIVVGVAYDPSVWGNRHVRRQSPTRNTRGPLCGGAGWSGFLQDVGAVVQVHVPGDTASVGVDSLTRPIGHVIAKT